MGSKKNGPAQDQAARLRIQTSLDESLIVEAAAGTGKTTALVGRLVAVLESGRTSVDRLVAVTFTRKAAGELKLRLRAGLDGARESATSADRIANLERAIADLEEARIGTIHAFCAELLRERPVEAAVDPAFRELSEEESPRLFKRAFRPWIEGQLQNPAPGFQRALSRSLLRRGVDLSPLDQIRSAAWKLLEWRDFSSHWRREPFQREVFIDRLLEVLRELAALSRQCDNYRDPLRVSLRPVRELDSWVNRAELDQQRDYDRLEGLLIDLLGQLRRDYRKGSGSFSPRLSRETVVGVREELLSILETWRQQADADLAAQLQDEMQQLVAGYEALKTQSGRLDFVDLLIRARNLLVINKNVRNYYQERFTHIFVDEFQDTDPTQAEILLLLAAHDPEEVDWTSVRPAPGKLFLVGDPKQSIYRFRRADVLLYQQIRKSLTARGVGLVQLTRSFRSVRPIQQLVNAAFETVMTKDEMSGQPGYVAMDEVRPALSDQPSVIALPVPRPYGVRDLANYAIEESLPEAAGAFLQWILEESGWKVADPEQSDRLLSISPRHVCILFRRFVSWGRDVTRPYTRALEAHRIPHLLVGSRSFHQREEVETLRAGLTAVEWPDDELSVYATLRGSLFGLSDSLLFEFREKWGSLHPFRPLPEDIDQSFVPVSAGLKLLAELHRRRNRRPIVQTLNRLMKFTRAHAGFALRPSGQQVLGNVQRVCDLARHFEAQGGASFRAFVEVLKEEAANPVAVEGPVLEEGVEGVRLMTVHAAKGLEFPVVLLADLTCQLSSSRPDKYVNVEEGVAAFTLMGCAPWDLLDHAETEQSRDETEGLRVAYVAATRARDLLIVPAVGDQQRKGWLSPLNKALYPKPGEWRSPRPPSSFSFPGDATVLERPTHFDGASEFSVRPGLHQPEIGEHGVIWWDPSILRLNVRPNFGIQQEHILRSDSEGEKAVEGLRAYESWQQRRQQLLARGASPQLLVQTVTELASLKLPPEECPVTVELLSVAPERPSGARFGTLVHTILRDVSLQASRREVAQLAQFHGRTLEVPEGEMAAAVEAVRSALKHPLLKRAARAERLYRELPLLWTMNQGEIVEGTLDLAFRNGRGWQVVDFKTDARIDSERARYEAQVKWYCYGLAQITGEAVAGWLLGI